MTHGSLFSGIGGFDLAAEWMGWENIFHCEWNPFGQKVLAHHFPNSKSYNDITKTDFTIHEGTIDVLSGGFPCQPYSSAGNRLGKEDKRHLFPEMLRTIKEIKPTWVVGENVLGIVNWGGGLVFEEVQTDLENQGYEVQAYILPACGKNAPHKRERTWFIAHSKLHENKHSNNGGSKQEKGNIWRQNEGNVPDTYNSNGIITNSKQLRLEHSEKRRNFAESKRKTQGEGSSFTKQFKTNGWTGFPTKPPICGGDDGLPRKLDSITFSKWRNESIKGYGNAVVPQIAYEIFKAIQSFEDMVNV
jgi:DNA (cytosine-5)-methyltransferase 1